MKYSRILLFSGMFIIQVLDSEIWAQEEADVENVFKVNVVSPGISYETRIGKKQTLYTEAFLALYFGFSFSSNYGSDFDFRAIPTLEAAYRYYYNGNRRANKGLATAMNNMNYFTFVYSPALYNEAVFEVYEYKEKLRLQHTIGVAWGFQRNYKSRISLDVYVGPGCTLSSSSGINDAGQSYSELNVDPTLVFKARFGFWLNRRRD